MPKPAHSNRWFLSAAIALLATALAAAPLDITPSDWDLTKPAAQAKGGNDKSSDKGGNRGDGKSADKDDGKGTGCTEIESVADKVGAVAAGWFGGNSLYSKMTREDARLASITMGEPLEGAEDRTPRGWSNRRSGDSGTITPLRT